MHLVWLLGIVVIISLSLICLVVRKKRKGQHDDEVPTSNNNDMPYPCNRKRYLSPAASKVLDDAMDAEDDRFRGSKTWN